MILILLFSFIDILNAAGACGNQLVGVLNTSACYDPVANSGQCSTIKNEDQCISQVSTAGQICTWVQNSTTVDPVKVVSEEEEDFFFEEAVVTTITVSLPFICVPFPDTICSKLSSESECKKTYDAVCNFTDKCLSVPASNYSLLKCQQKISHLACTRVTAEACKWDSNNGKCDIYTDQNCVDFANRLNCNPNKDNQCYYRYNMSYPSQSGCINYSPKNCSGDNGVITTQMTCKRIDNLCKWTNSMCLGIQGDPCNTTGINKYGCLYNPQKCVWNYGQDNYDVNHKDGFCSNFNENSTTCLDGRNRRACIESTISCTYQNDRCITFDNYTHNCQNILSHSACREVPFPCGWNSTLMKCFNFRDVYGCSLAANEVACLISSKGCKWYDNNFTCVIDPELQSQSTFWNTWNETQFDIEFEKEYKTALKEAEELKKKEEEKAKKAEKLAAAKKSKNTTASNSTETNGSEHSGEPQPQQDSLSSPLLAVLSLIFAILIGLLI